MNKNSIGYTEFNEPIDLVMITGIGGSGKTTTARKCAMISKAHYTSLDMYNKLLYPVTDSSSLQEYASRISNLICQCIYHSWFCSSIIEGYHLMMPRVSNIINENVNKSLSVWDDKHSKGKIHLIRFIPSLEDWLSFGSVHTQKDDPYKYYERIKSIPTPELHNNIYLEFSKPEELLLYIGDVYNERSNR